MRQVRSSRVTVYALLVLVLSCVFALACMVPGMGSAWADDASESGAASYEQEQSPDAGNGGEQEGDGDAATPGTPDASGDTEQPSAPGDGVVSPDPGQPAEPDTPATGDPDQPAAPAPGEPAQPDAPATPDNSAGIGSDQPSAPGDGAADGADKPAEGDGSSADKPAEKPAEAPADKPADAQPAPADKPAEAPTDKPAENPAEPAAPADEQPSQATSFVPGNLVSEKTAMIVSPSGNIGCDLSAHYAGCGVLSYRSNGTYGKDEAGSPKWWFDLSSGGTPQLAGRSEGAFSLDEAFRGGGSSPQVVEYGQSVTFGSWVCSSEETGMTCRNTETGHGVFLSSGRYETF